MAPSFPRSTTASKWGLVFRVHIHPRYPLLLRFFFSDVSVHTIEALGLAVERKKNSPRREKESISLLLFHSSVAYLYIHLLEYLTNRLLTPPIFASSLNFLRRAKMSNVEND